MAIERVEEQATVVVGGAAVDEVATGDALSRRGGLGLVFPLRGAGLLKIKGVENIWVRRDDVHRVADDERCRLLAAIDAGRKRPSDAKRFDVFEIDLIQVAIASVGVVLGGYRPLGFRHRDSVGGDR